MRKLALPEEILLSIQQPARYIGGEVNMVKKNPSLVDIRFAMCFPDVYDIGMSHLGIQILYDMFNKYEDVYCERVYSPWTDLDKIMREKHIPLFALESQDPVKEFDFLGITLQYEMCYTNILQVLELSDIPLHAEDRTWDDPVVIGGGPCSYNPEPIAVFFDMFYIGEGEISYRKLLDVYKESRKNGDSRQEFLRKAAGIPGIYVPSLYEVTYEEDGTIRSFLPTATGVPEKVEKQLVMEMTESVYPEKPLVPFIKATQDRVVLEIMRGCIRGCRFCQAGMIYRPVREKNVEHLKELAYKMLKSTGHEEISLSSLSSRDNFQSITDLQIPDRTNRKTLRPIQHIVTGPACRCFTDHQIPFIKRCKLLKHLIDPSRLSVRPDDKTAVSVFCRLPAPFYRIPPFLIPDLRGNSKGTFPGTQNRRLPCQRKI
jgi:radical SAM family uncharacterized protein